MDVGEHSRAVRPSRSGEEVIQIAIRLGLLAFLIYWSFVPVASVHPDPGLGRGAGGCAKSRI